MAQRNFRNTVWTDHALERLHQRGITQEMVAETIANPDNSTSGKRPRSTQFQKQFEGRTLSVIAQPKGDTQWRILSTWLKPALEGTNDWEEAKRYQGYRKEYERAGFWGKFWVVLKRQLGF